GVSRRVRVEVTCQARAPGRQIDVAGEKRTRQLTQLGDPPQPMKADLVSAQHVDQKSLRNPLRPAAMEIDHLPHQRVVFIDEDAALSARPNETVDLPEALAGRGRVVQDPDRDDAIENALDEWQLV